MKTLTHILLKPVLLMLVSFTTFIANARIAATPVNKANFTAVLAKNNKVDLKWSTEIEKNLSHFIVEKSTDGKKFSDAVLVFAYGNTTSESVYAFSDNISKIESGVVYYRLVTINEDGKMQYSGIHTIKITKQADHTNTINDNPETGTNELLITIPANCQKRNAEFIWPGSRVLYC